jgi:hypothetical protein
MAGTIPGGRAAAQAKPVSRAFISELAASVAARVIPAVSAPTRSARMALQGSSELQPRAL